MNTSQCDDEVEVSKKDLGREHNVKEETQRAIGAHVLTDSFHPRESNLTSVQEGSSQNLTTKALDEPGEREAGGSTKESDERLEMEGTKQVTEDHFDVKEASEEEEDECLGKKQKTSKLRNWWRKMWPAPSDLQSRVQKKKQMIQGQSQRRIQMKQAKRHSQHVWGSLTWMKQTKS